MSAHPLPVPRTAALEWARIRHAGGRIAIVAALVLGVWAWLDSTRPHDPLYPGPGLGIEGGGSTQVALGQGRIYSFYLLGATPRSRLTVTGVTMPHIPGVRLQMDALVGSPQGQFMGFPLTNHPGHGDPSAGQLRPLIGRSLHAPPAVFHPPDWVLTAALVVTPLTPGCHRITGVAIHYRVGDTTFTRSMDGAISVSTGTRTCDA